MKKNKLNKKFLQSLIFLMFGFFVLIFSLGVVFVASVRIPDFQALNDRKIANSTKIYDRTGENLLFDIHQDVRRTSLSFEEMGSNIKNATVAIEDSTFYQHKGIRITAIIRAVLSNTFNLGKTQGGSTITQQLIKNTLLTSKKTIGRKIKEWILAVKIEQVMSKEKILELYLNEAPYGGTIYGIEEASKNYFGKKSQELSLTEAAYLAAIPQAPTTLSPYGKNIDRLENRKNYVLLRMLETKMISQEEYEEALLEKVEFLPQSAKGIKAPHFVFYLKNYLEKKYGADVVLNGGLKVISTLDYDLQIKAEEIVKNGALENEKNWNGSNAGLVAIDPKTGQILTMVGSRDYFDEKIDGNYNISTARRQPGSAFKPFIYAAAFNKGFTPETVLFDLPTEFNASCNAYGQAVSTAQRNCYKPANYDGKFRGPMSLRDALGQSINVIAVKLFYLAGMTDSLRVAEEMGINTLSDISRYGLTLVIGGGEVSLLDITSAYGVFANNGIKNNSTGILKIENFKGDILEEFKLNSKNVLPQNTALLISDILSDNQARIPTFGANSALHIPGKDVAAKTGTTNNNRDAWTVGYSPNITVGVWAGNNDNTPMKKGGVSVAGPIWNSFIKEALKKLPDEKFEKPTYFLDPLSTKPLFRGHWQGNDNFFIDKISGKLATQYTPNETLEEKVLTEVHTILHWVDKNEIHGPPPINPRKDSQYNNWEIPIQNWWSQNKYKYPIITINQKPTGYDDVHTENSGPVLLINEPNTGKIYEKNKKIQLGFLNPLNTPLQKIDIFINNVFIDTIKNPFLFSFIPAELENLNTLNEIKLIAYDVFFNKKEIISTFQVE